MSKLTLCGVVALAILGYFASVGMFHTINDMMSRCDKPGIYILTQDDKTITSCHNGQPTVWQKAVTVVVGEEAG